MKSESVSKIIGILKEHHAWLDESLPMIASENVTSLLVREALISDFGHRYAEGKPFKRFYQGCRFIDELESFAIELAKKLFNAPHVDLRPVSGTVANLAAYYALAKHGDRMVALSVAHGGHISHAELSAAGVMGLRTYSFPFDEKKMNINVDEGIKLVKEIKPKLILFGASLFLFPHPVKEFREVADEVNAYIIYDAAHVLGLIAGKQFQDPLREGADVVTASHHKTFFGPQGGLIISKSEELGKKIEKAVFPGLVSNHHLHHLAGLAITLAEFLEFGEEYAKQTIANAKALAQALYDRGFNVLCPDLGFTESHQIAVDVRDLGGGAEVAETLERNNIIINKNLLPWDDIKNAKNPSGIRIGVQEITRLGMRESEMDYIAELFKKAVVDKKDVKDEVRELRKEFRKIKYTFVESDAYKYISLSEVLA